jgi:hypothetical protein
MTIVSPILSDPTYGPSLHLTWDELSCKDGTAYPMIWRATRAVVLAQEFEGFRHFCGDRSITVESAFRTYAHNRAIGGAGNSQHVQGRALDLVTPKAWTVEQFWGMAVAWAKREEGSMAKGIGRYPWGVHLDTRPSDRLVVWNGNRPDADISADV